jgi:hypothetical protein
MNAVLLKHAHMEVQMTGKMTFIGLVALGALGVVVGVTSMASAQLGGGPQGGEVLPCSLAGVNPADHPNIFNNPEVARQQYGFVRAPDGSWQVIPNCESQIKR